MKKIIKALSLLIVSSCMASAAVGPQINGNQINSQTAISISTLNVTGATGLTTTKINSTGSNNTIGPYSTNSSAVYPGADGSADLGTTGNRWQSIYGAGWSVLRGTANFSGSATANNFIGPATGLTGTAASLTAGNVTTNANLTGVVTSVGNATSFAASPTFTGTVSIPTLSGPTTSISSFTITHASGLLIKPPSGAADIRFYSGDNSGALVRIGNSSSEFYFDSRNPGRMEWDPPSGIGISLATSNGDVCIGCTTSPNGHVTISSSGASSTNLYVAGSPNNYAQQVKGNIIAGQSYGMLIDAGTNSSDVAVRVRNQNGGSDLFQVRGDGFVNIGAAAVSAPNQYGCRATDATTQSWGTAVEQIAYFGTNTFCTPSSMHSTTVSSGTFTIPSDGVGTYSVIGKCVWNNTLAGQRLAELWYNGVRNFYTALPGNATVPLTLQISDVYQFANNATIQLRCYQDSGGTVTTGGDTMVFSIQKLW